VPRSRHGGGLTTIGRPVADPGSVAVPGQAPVLTPGLAGALLRMITNLAAASCPPVAGIDSECQPSALAS
jgi:hypothetical protein